MFLNFKSKHFIKSIMAKIEKKKYGGLTCESIPSENPNTHTYTHTNTQKNRLKQNVSGHLPTFRKSYSYLAALNLLIHKFVKLSIIERILPFNLFLLLKTLHLSKHLANYTIMGRHWFLFWHLFDESGQYSLHRYLYPFLI